MTQPGTVAPAGGEWLGTALALLPLMLLVMMMRAMDKLLEPEVIREIKPIAEDVIMAKMGRKA